MSDQVVAFAGAEGYGASTTGGRGGAVLHVTNLNDNGAGSLRWALEQQSGARTIVFDVGGTISLKSQILVQNGDVTIAGQTAPGEGITIEGARVRIKADNVIVRGMHFRPGDGADGQAAGDRDGLMIGTTDFTMKNIIVDHNSFSWAIDENVDINGHVRNITVSNNIIAEGLSKSIHPKGEHSKGMLVSNWTGSAGDEDTRITILGNLFSDNTARNPEVRAGQDIEIVNNYIYNYGYGYSAIAVGGGSEGTLTTTVKIVGNVMTPGLSTASAARTPISFEKMGANSSVALVDNINSVQLLDRAGNQLQSALYAGLNKVPVTAAITADGKLGSGASVLDSSQVAAWVLANVGAVNGSGRDAVDTRIVGEVAAGVGTIINAVSQVQQTKMAYATGAADSDRDGMPDWFEQVYGLDRAKADQNGDNDRDGYTNLEEYINGLISGFDLGQARIGGHVSGAQGAVLPGAAATLPVAVDGFHSGSGKIDLSAVLSGYAAGQSLGDWVEIAYATGNSYISAGSADKRVVVAVVAGAHVTLADLTVAAQTASTGSGGGGGGGDTATLPAPVAPVQPAPSTPVVVTQPVALPPVYRYITGTSGNDNITIKSELDRVTEKVNGGTDQVTSYIRTYTLDANVENLGLRGSAAFDGIGNELGNKMAGNENANMFDGGAGDDKLYGLDGNDRLFGGVGADWVQGDGGNDVLWGGKGADTLVGGTGCDAFCFASGDSLASASAVEDRINDFGAGDVIFVDGHALDLTLAAATTIKTSKYADAYAAASKLMAQGGDTALVHSSKDAWVFWDNNHDGRIDGGVLLSGAEVRVAEWLVKPADLTIL